MSKDISQKKIGKLIKRMTDKFGYDAVPEVNGCKKCGRCCGPVTFHLDELDAAYEYLELTGQNRTADAARIWFLKMMPKDGNLVLKHPSELQCPFFRASKGCTVYPVRPMTCRQYGISMDKSFGRCPNGARSERQVDFQGLSALMEPYFKTVAAVKGEGAERAKLQDAILDCMTQLSKVWEAYAFGATLMQGEKVIIPGDGKPGQI